MALLSDAERDAIARRRAPSPGRREKAEACWDSARPPRMRLRPNGKHRTAAGTVAQGLRPGRGSAPLTVERAGVLRIVPCHWRIAFLRRRDLVTVSPSHRGLHKPVSVRNVEFSFIRNVDRVKDHYPRALIRIVADDARERIATVIEVDDARQIIGSPVDRRR